MDPRCKKKHSRPPKDQIFGPREKKTLKSLPGRCPKETWGCKTAHKQTEHLNQASGAAKTRDGPQKKHERKHLTTQSDNTPSDLPEACALPIRETKRTPSPERRRQRAQEYLHTHALQIGGPSSKHIYIYIYIYIQSRTTRKLINAPINQKTSFVDQR